MKIKNNDFSNYSSSKIRYWLFNRAHVALKTFSGQKQPLLK